jgi:ABC-type branched-subunit amino acid transport system substrate-binding protein
MMTKGWVRTIAVGAGLTLVAGACGGRDADDEAATDDGGDTATTAAGEGGAGGEGGGEPEPVAGFDGTTIRLGALTPTSGRVAVIGNPLTAGNQAYFDYVNEELGGIAGQYPIELVVRDTAYAEPTAVQEYNATKDDVVMYAQILGTPIVNALVGQLTTDGVVAAPASLDSFWVREQSLLPVGAPYQIQAINALDYWVTDGGGEGDVICSLIQDDPYGEAGQEGLDFAAAELDIELGPTVTFPSGNPDFTTQIGQLEGAGCEMVFLVSTPADTGAALGKAAEVGYAPQFIGQSPSWIGLLAQSGLGPYLQENFLLASEGPNYGDESVPGMAELIRIQETYSEQAPDTYFNFGYLQAVAVTQVLEAAVANGDLSHEGIIEAMNGIEVFEYDGLSGDYEWGPPEDRNPPRTSTIFRVNPEAPIGLEAVEVDIESDAALAFEFEE